MTDLMNLGQWPYIDQMGLYNIVHFCTLVGPKTEDHVQVTFFILYLCEMLHRSKG